MPAQVFVRNLDRSTSEDDLAQAFSPYGQLIDYVSPQPMDVA